MMSNSERRVALTEDVISAILLRVDDTSVMERIASATPQSHPVFSLALKRRLQSLITLDILAHLRSTEYILLKLLIQHPELSCYTNTLTAITLAKSPSRPGQQLLDLLISRPQLASYAYAIHVNLGPSKNWYNTFRASEADRKSTHPAVAFATRFSEKLVDLWPLATNLRHVTWTRAPGPDQRNLQAIASLPNLTSFAVDCATNDWVSEDMDESWTMEPFFDTLAPRLTAIDFQNVEKRSFETIAQKSSSMIKLRNLKIDVTCGTWDWNGEGSPQEGPTWDYEFPRLDCADTIKMFEVTASDLTMRGLKKGPMSMIDPARLEKLVIHVIPCYYWITIRGIRVFSGLHPSDFTSLGHFEIDDRRYYAGKCEVEEKPDELHGGRIYFGIHEFIAGLEKLQSLWLSEEILRLPSQADDSPDALESWSSSRAEFMPLEQTWSDHRWMLVGEKLKQVSSLRVGIGRVNATELAQVLACCDPSRLAQLGFEWNWRTYAADAPISPDLLALLSSFSHLKDIHIFYPRPIPASQLRSQGLDHRSDAQALADVQSIFETCRFSCRVGIGKNVVWERSIEGGISLVGREHVPDFYNSGWDWEDESTVGWKRRGVAKYSETQPNRRLVGLLRRAMQKADDGLGSVAFQA